MQLVIDVGNTRLKLALFENNELIKYHVCKNADELLTQKWLDQFTISNCILVTVVDKLDDFIKLLETRFPVLVYNNLVDTTLVNKYATPETLGGDRLVAAVAANHLFPNNNVLVVDVGTCIKYNFVDSEKTFLGGAISPGLRMRLKAINSFTARLPLLEVDDNYNDMVANTTNNNILAGATLGAVAEVNGFIELYEQRYDMLKVVLTGGDLNFFENRLKKSIFADAFLTLKGLNVILNHNLALRS